MYECCTSATAFLPDPDPDPDPDPEPTFLDVRFWILVRIWLKIISSNMFHKLIMAGPFETETE